MTSSIWFLRYGLRSRSGRKFNHDTDGFLDGDLTQTVYPIAGTVTGWQCTPLGGINADPGKNCLRHLPA